MRRAVLFFAMLTLLVSAVPAQAGQEAMIVHFVVVNPTVDGVDYSAKLPGLEKLFLRLAGGFTDMGRTRGGALGEDSIKREAHLTYIIAAKKDIAAQIHEYVRENLRTDPFILTWPAEVFSPPAQ